MGKIRSAAHRPPAPAGREPAAATTETRSSAERSLQARVRTRHLALVVALADLGSLRRAASAIALTQPAATKLLHDLEDAMGAPLFERHRWGMTPTPAGDTLVLAARGMLNDLAHAHADIAARGRGAIGSLRIGAVTGAVPRFLAPAIVALRRERPGLRVFALVNSSEVLVDALRRGDLEVAIAPRPPDDPLDGIAVAPLALEPLAVVARAGHPLARARRIDLASLAGATWIVPPSGSPLRRDFDAFHAAAGLRLPADLIETVSIVATLALLQASEALSLVADNLARHYERHGGIVRLAVALPATGTRYEVMTRAGRVLGPAAAGFVAEVLALAAPRRS